MVETVIALIASKVIEKSVEYLSKAGGTAAEKTGEKIVEVGFEHKQAIWETIKGLFQREELITLNLLEEFPANQDIQTKVSGQIEKSLEANPTVAKQLVEEHLHDDPEISQNLATILTKLKELEDQLGSEVKQNTQTQSGTGNIANQDGNQSVNQQNTQFFINTTGTDNPKK